MQRCLAIQRGRHAQGRLLEEGQGSVLQSDPLLTKCYTWIQISSEVPCVKEQVFGGGQLGGGGTSLWSAMKFSKRLGPQQADLIIERPSDHEGFDPVSRSIPW